MIQKLPRRTPGASRLVRDKYEPIAEKIDGMKVDDVLRFPQAVAPRVKWFFLRAELNQFKVRTHLVGEEIVVLRVA